MSSCDELNFNIYALTFSRFLFKGWKKSSKFKIFIYVLELLSYLLMKILAITHFLTRPISLYTTILVALVSNNGFQTIFRHLYFAYKAEEIENLLDLLNNSPCNDTPLLQELETEMKRKSKKNIKRFSTYVFAYHACAFFVGTILPIIVQDTIVLLWSFETSQSPNEFSETRYLYVYEIWWPSDIYVNSNYVVLLLWQGLTMLLYIASLCTSDAFVCSLMLAAAERSEMLARAAPQALLPGPGNSITQEFRAWVKHHQHYLRIVREINDAMGPLIFSTHLFASLNIISCVYVAIKLKDIGGVISSVTCIFLMVGFLIQIFIYSSCGHKIISKSEKLGRSVVGVAQVARGGLGAGASRSALQVILSRCSGTQPQKIYGMGFFTVSMELFATVLSASVTYLLVLLQFP